MGLVEMIRASETVRPRPRQMERRELVRLARRNRMSSCRSRFDGCEIRPRCCTNSGPTLSRGVIAYHRAAAPNGVSLTMASSAKPVQPANRSIAGAGRVCAATCEGIASIKAPRKATTQRRESTVCLHSRMCKRRLSQVTNQTCCGNSQTLRMGTSQAFRTHDRPQRNAKRSTRSGVGLDRALQLATHDVWRHVW